MWRFGGHPRGRGATARAATGPVTWASAVVRPPMDPLQLRGLIRDVGNVQGVVLKLVPIQLLDGSEKDEFHILSDRTLSCHDVVSSTYN